MSSVAMTSTNLTSAISLADSKAVLTNVNISKNSFDMTGLKIADCNGTISFVKIDNVKGDLILISTRYPAISFIRMWSISLQPIDNTKNALTVLSSRHLGKLEIFDVHISPLTAQYGSLIALLELFAFNNYSSILDNKETNISFYMKCPVNYNPVRERSRVFLMKYQYFCLKCKRGLYSIQNGSITTHLYMSKYKPIKESSNVTLAKCYNCPSGGDCTDDLVSKDNFWGHAEDNNRILFLPCPEGYCCTKDKTPCASYNTCTKYRTGTLCGNCRSGYFADFFSNSCIKRENCNQVTPFWVLFLCHGFLYTSIIAFLDDLPAWAKKAWSFIRQKSFVVTSKLKNICIKSPNNDSMQIPLPIAYYVNARCLETTIGENITEVIANNDVVTDACLTTMESNHSAECNLTHKSSKNKSLEVVRKLNVSPIGNSVDKKNNGQISGIISVLIAFYQIKKLITVKIDVQFRNLYHENFLTSILNFELFEIGAKLCPTFSLDDVQKIAIRNGLFPILLLFITITTYGVALLVLTFKSCWKGMLLKRKKLGLRVSICIISIILWNYVNIVMLTLTLINCRQITNEKVLYINGNMQCFVWWQFLCFIFLSLWVILFCPSAYFAVKLLHTGCLSLGEFHQCFLIPFLTPFYYKKSKIRKTVYLEKNARDNVQALVNLFENPFRQNKNGNVIIWEVWRLSQRLLIAVFAVFFINPLERISYIAGIMLILQVIHIRVKPYKEKLVNLLETASLTCLCLLVTMNLLRAYLFVYNIPNQESMTTILRVFSILELIFSPVMMLCFFYAFNFVKFCFARLRKLFHNFLM
ncbi:uncharacterized protein LOC130613985 [Hydractinia symbiolongicarpus]|uniref:uncharacterized protein LOC130613985 n=1 Tax=Hydractinia symbiolongicarpus TaxID=13093 RepID=UPI00254BBFCB|nr:uncharacterized protein LOC130613985 [Hydractinia symbiolongicarpus]XP_057291348.1 uncharacterized protein LOC130613985 [Hydractinia symbiolongicarpus]